MGVLCVRTTSNPNESFVLFHRIIVSLRAIEESARNELTAVTRPIRRLGASRFVADAFKCPAFATGQRSPPRSVGGLLPGNSP